MIYRERVRNFAYIRSPFTFHRVGARVRSQCVRNTPLVIQTVGDLWCYVCMSGRVPYVKFYLR